MQSDCEQTGLARTHELILNITACTPDSPRKWKLQGARLHCQNIFLKKPMYVRERQLRLPKCTSLSRPLFLLKRTNRPLLRAFPFYSAWHKRRRRSRMWWSQIFPSSSPQSKQISKDKRKASSAWYAPSATHVSHIISKLNLQIRRRNLVITPQSGTF